MSKHYHEIITLTIDRRDKSHKISPDDVIRAVAAVHGITTESMLSKSRRRMYAWPRQMVYLIMRERCTYLSWPQIARKCRRLDHSSVLMGAAAMEARIEVHLGCAEAYSRVNSRLDVLYQERMKAHV